MKVADESAHTIGNKTFSKSVASACALSNSSPDDPINSFALIEATGNPQVARFPNPSDHTRGQQKLRFDQQVRSR